MEQYWHTFTIALFIILNGIIGFFVARLYNKIDNLDARVGSLEVSEGEIKTDLKYIRASIDDIKDWIKNSQKGPL